MYHVSAFFLFVAGANLNVRASQTFCVKTLFHGKKMQQIQDDKLTKIVGTAVDGVAEGWPEIKIVGASDGREEAISVGADD